MKCNNHLCQSEGISQCSKCKQVYYCSRQCQQISWKKHKHECCEKVDKVEENDDDDDNNDGNDEDEKVEKDNNNDETLSKTMRRYCLNCLKQLEHSNKNTCSRCRTATYCNQICQTEHWKVHKRTCQDSNYDHGFQKLYAKAVNYKDQGNFKKAYKAYKKINDFLSETSVYPCPEEEESSVRDFKSQIMNQLGEVCIALGKLKESEKVLDQCLNEQKNDERATFKTLHNLSYLYSKMARYPEAEKILLRVIKRKEELFGRDQADVIEETHELANIYECQGKYADAERLMMDCLHKQKIVKNVKDTDKVLADLKISTILASLSDIYKNQGRYVEAESHLKQSLEIVLSLKGENSIDYITSLGNLGGLYYSQGRSQEALEVLEAVLKKKLLLQGDSHISTLNTMSFLGSVYTNLGRLDDAEKMHRNCLEKRKEAFGPNHNDVIESMHNLAGTISDNGDLSAAEALYLECLEKQKLVLGENHPFYLVTMNTLGLTYDRQGKYELSEETLKKCYLKKIAVYGYYYFLSLSSSMLSLL